MTRVLIVGGGALGTICALLAARRGFAVDIVERETELWSGASVANEGKVHLGPVFALAEPSTHDIMMRAALAFSDVIEEALDATVDWSAYVGDPFEYLVMPGSLASPEELRSVYRSINDRMGERRRYLGDFIDLVVDPTIGRDPSTGLPVFRTLERAVNPRSLGRLLVGALRADDLITVRAGVAVERLTPRDDGRVDVTMSGVGVETVDYVINCAWEQQQSLIPASSATSRLNYRLKTAVRLTSNRGARTVTLVQGPFGDVVRHDDHVYASWYPIARLSNEYGVGPSAAALSLQRSAASQLAQGEQQVAALRDIGVLSEDEHIEEVLSGFIVGHGALDIDSRSSLLHSRSEFGIHRVGSILSPVTFKLTTAPLAAREAVGVLSSLAGVRR